MALREYDLCPTRLSALLWDTGGSHMMQGLRHALLVSGVIAAPAVAQNPESVPRAIVLPDTMGANFAAGDTLTGKSGPTDYDFLLGTWRFTFQARRRDGRSEERRVGKEC